MDPLSLALFGGGQLASLIMNIIGGIKSEEGRKAALQAAQEAEQMVKNVGAPPNLAAPILLEKFKAAGVMTPELEDKFKQGAAEISKFQEDPRFKEAQMSALQAIQQRAKVGLSPEDRASLNKIRQEMASEAEAKRQQIIQNLQARGQAGSGAELAAQLSAQQSAATRGSQEGDRLAAMASQNALQAIMQGGQLAGQVRGQEFSQAQSRAEAQDRINQFNMQNAINRKNMYDQLMQNIADRNVQQANQERYRQNEAQRQYWADKAGQAQTMANIHAGIGTQQANQAQQQAQQWGQFGSGLGSAGTTLASSLAKQTTNKDKTSQGTKDPYSDDFEPLT